MGTPVAVCWCWKYGMVAMRGKAYGRVRDRRLSFSMGSMKFATEAGVGEYVEMEQRKRWERARARDIITPCFANRSVTVLSKGRGG